VRLRSLIRLPLLIAAIVATILGVAKVTATF
jgi:hypothetical protein